MYISNKDLELLEKIEVFLYVIGKHDLFFELWKLNVKLLNNKDKNNKKNSKRIAEKRKINKNYAR